MTLAGKIKARIRIEGGCWVWQGAKTWKGYGRVVWQGRTFYTHRAMFEASIGPIPTGKQIDHLCRNTACCNPEHLEAVTPAENTRRGRSVEASHQRRGQAAQCPVGHAYTPGNSYFDKRGNRSCKACRKTRNEAWNELRKSRAYRTFTAQGGNAVLIASAKNG